MTDVLDELGWLQGVLVNERSGLVIDGHMRLDLAVRQGQPTIPVSYVDLSDQEEATVLATLNPLGTLADANELKRLALREKIATDRETLRRLAGFTAPPGRVDDDPEADDDITDRTDLLHDHTRLIAEEDVDRDDLAEKVYEEDPENAYAAMTIKTVNFIMQVHEYAPLIDALEDLCDREGLETNADAVIWLVRHYGPEDDQ